MTDLVRSVADSYDPSGRLAEDALRRLAWRSRRGGKTCSACGETKPVREFGRDGTRPDGLEPRCRSCRSTLPQPRPTT